MKIVFINGSPRKNGITAQILHTIEGTLKRKADIETEFINISDYSISPCLGCCLCYKTGKCHIKDEGDLLSEKISKADGIIIGTPTYASNVSGQLKTFIDRGHFVIEQLLNKKYAICVSTGENYGNRDSLKVLTKLISYSGARLSAKIKCTQPFNSEIEKKYISKSVKAAERLYRDITKEKKYLLQAMFHKVIYTVGIKPFVLRKGSAYHGVITRWKEMQLIE